MSPATGFALIIGRALPVLAAALVIDERGLHRDRQRRRAGIGPQAQVGAEDVAVAGALLHDAHQPAHHAGEYLAHLIPVPGDAGIGIEEDDDVDVGGIVQLTRAMLAHAKHDQAGFLARVFGIRQGQLARFVAAAQQVIESRSQCRIGKVTERCGGVARIDQPRQIMQRQCQRHPPLGPAQLSHQFALADRRALRIPP
jgi:hypothetical protein